MLGKDHINISIAFIIPFIVPLFFIDSGNMVLAIAFAVAVLIGSLVPDTDCGGKATIYYRFPIVDEIMKNVIGKSIMFVFSLLISKKKIKAEHEVGGEHRGILHSPVGVLLSSIMLTLPILIFALVFSLFNPFVILFIFLGLLIGQLLHLFEDSCTISGINWGFPFKTYELKGKIYTFSKDKERKDIRPTIYGGLFHALSILLVLGYAFNYLTDVSTFIVYLLIVVYEIVGLFVILNLSQISDEKWLMKKEAIRHNNKVMRRLQKNASKVGI